MGSRSKGRLKGNVQQPDRNGGQVEESPPRNAGGVLQRRVTATFEGPLPPPGLLKAYDEVVPGSAAEIIAMAHKQSNHRQDLEKAVVTSGISRETEGARFAFTLYFASLISGTYLISIGKSTTGLVQLLATTATFAGLFLYSKISKQKELKSRQEALEPATSDLPEE